MLIYHFSPNDSTRMQSHTQITLFRLRRSTIFASSATYEYVPSKANIADLPSRGDTRLAMRMLRDRFGVAVEARSMRLPPLRAVDGV